MLPSPRPMLPPPPPLREPPATCHSVAVPHGVSVCVGPEVKKHIDTLASYCARNGDALPLQCVVVAALTEYIL